MTAKALALRLPAGLHVDLQAVAAVDGQPMAEVVRLAIAAYINRRAEQPDWPALRDATRTRMGRLAQEDPDA